VTKQLLLECSFLIPIRRDANLSDGEIHEPEIWDWLDNQLFEQLGGATVSPENCRGFYQDPDTGERVDDESTRYVVAVPEEKIDELRSLLSLVCARFHQKCIYLSIAGNVEFIEVRR
jgi:hypothetical protein